MYKDPEARRAYLQNYQRLWLRERRAKAIEFLGGVCVVCGSNNNLEFHHKNPALKGANISQLLSRKWEFMLAELGKCELRCENHHTEIHTPPHGTIARYSSSGSEKCRCDICLTAWREYKRVWEPVYRAKKKVEDPFYRRKKPMECRS